MLRGLIEEDHGDKHGLDDLLWNGQREEKVGFEGFALLLALIAAQSRMELGAEDGRDDALIGIGVIRPRATC